MKEIRKYRGLIIVAAVLYALLAVPGIVGAVDLTLVAWLLMGCALVAGLGALRLSPDRSRAAAWVIIAVWWLMSAGIEANVFMYTTKLGGTLDNPVLTNSDARFYFFTAENIIYEGFQGRLYDTVAIVYAVAMAIFGTNIYTPLILNMVLILISLALTGYVTATVCRPLVAPRRSATLAMVLTAIVAFYLSLGTVMLKDAWAILAIALAAAALTELAKDESKQHFWASALMMLGAAIILWFIRVQYLAYLMVGIVIFTRWRSRLRLKRSALLASIVLAVFASYHIQRSEIDVQPYEQLTEDDFKENYIYETDSNKTYTDFLTAKMESYPKWMRLVCLPISCGVQYMIPFFWTGTNDLTDGYTMVYAHMGFGWYLLGGLILYYLLLKIWRAPTEIKRMMLWGLVMWIVPAYMVSGLVSRYFMPSIVALVPGAVLTLERYRKKRSFKIFSAIYIAAIIAALVIAHHLQY